MNLVVFPFQTELKAFLNASKLTENKVGGYRVFATPFFPQWKFAVCGQGKVEAAMACCILADSLKAESVLLFGSATALNPSLNPGDIVVAEECVEVDFKSWSENGIHSPPRFKSTLNSMPSWTEPDFHVGKILSGDGDLFDSTEKKRLGEEHHALAYAWEGAGFHRALRRLGKPGLEIRVITETMQEPRLSKEIFQDRVVSGLFRLQPILPKWESFSNTPQTR